MLKARLQAELEKAKLQNFVIHTSTNGESHDQYWNWCKKQNLPFVKVTKEPRKRKVSVVLDMFTTDKQLTEEGIERVKFLLMAITEDKSSYGYGKERSYSSGVTPERAEPAAQLLFVIANESKCVQLLPHLSNKVSESSIG